MLLRFNISNFLSFNNEQEFSMFPGKVQKFNDRLIRDKKLSTLKFCALYGANASGKSNLIKAIDIAKEIIISGIHNMDYSDMYCKLKEENKNKATKFEFEIKVNDCYYAYGFTANLNDGIVLGEWLYEITPTEEIMIFERDMKNKEINHEIIFKDESNKSKFDVYSQDIMNMNNVLLLSEIKRKNLKEKDFEVFSNIFSWFKDKLKIIYPDTVIGTFSRMFNTNCNLDIIKLLDYFDTGITGYKMENSSMEELKKYMSSDEYERFIRILKKPLYDLKENKKLKKVTVQGTLRTDKHLFQLNFGNKEWEINKLLFKHGKNCDLMFEFGEESDGTRRLIELLDVIHNDKEDNIFLIDELDRSLHPQMTKKFVETFFKATKEKHTQLFITTHESNLLDLEFLRRDEVWFVERDQDYSSKLFSLENFKVRYDKKIDKAYLEGRYGAVPVFKDFDSYVGDKKEEC